MREEGRAGGGRKAGRRRGWMLIEVTVMEVIEESHHGGEIRGGERGDEGGG